MMPPPRRCWTTALLLIATLALLRAADAPAVSPQPWVTVRHLFKYQAPAGWTVRSIDKFSNYPIARNEANTSVMAQITVDMETASEPLADWSKAFLAKDRASLTAYQVRSGDLEPFIMSAGAKGFRARLDFSANLGSTTLQLHYAYYFFEGSKNARFAVACCCDHNDADHDGPLFDTAMKTFVAE
jgi:hypothetical protein